MSKKFGNISVDDWSISTREFIVDEKVELSPEEAEMYSLLFDREEESPNRVKEPLRDCLKTFVEADLNHSDRHKFVNLCDEAIMNCYDAVEKQGKYVVNSEGDAELLCQERVDGEWRLVATLEKEVIRKFHKQKNHSIPNGFSGFSLSSSASNPSGTGTVTTNPSIKSDSIVWNED